MSDDPLDELARATVAALVSTSSQLVLAESCTAGLIAATLGRVPGVSAVLCGSAVVYQIETKASWLQVDSAILDDPGPVSSEVAIAMATSVLNQTPQATLALSITGHLGPDAPSELDGTAWIGIASRESTPTAQHVFLKPLREVAIENEMSPVEIRLTRQQDAVLQSLDRLLGWLEQTWSRDTSASPEQAGLD